MFSVTRKQLLIAGGITIVVMLLFSIFRKMKAAEITAILHGGTTEDNNVKAFLMTIRRCEGTAGENGYRMLFGGGLFDSFDGHPNIVVRRSGYVSTAAGAYQILFRTWVFCKTLVDGLDDFSPENQDKAAIALINYRNALADVKAGRFEAAIEKCGKEWASLPGSPYGQPVKTMAQAKSFYLNAGGNIA